MTRAVGNGMVQALANAIGTGAVGKLAKQVAGLLTDVANIKTYAPDKKNVDEFISPTEPELITVSNGASIYTGINTLKIYNLHIYGSLFIAITLPPTATEGEPWNKYVTVPEAYNHMDSILVVGQNFRGIVNMESFFKSGTVPDYSLNQETKLIYFSPAAVFKE